MAWDNANFLSGDANMQQYQDTYTGNGTIMQTAADKAFWDTNLFANDVFMQAYNDILKEANGDPSVARKMYKDKYGMDPKDFIEAQKAAVQQHTADRAAEMTNTATQNLKKIQAREATIANREASAKQAQAQARTQGMSKGLAASIGNAPLSGQQSANYGNNLSALKNLGQTTQNDYLQKMGYANALEQQADNMEKGSRLNVIGAAIGGAGSGASVGASLFGGMGKGD